MRFNLLPDPKFFSQVGALEDRIFAAVDLINPDNFLDFAESAPIAALEQGIRMAQGDEGTIWLVDRPAQTLVPVYNNGPSAETWVGKFRQPLSAGIISMVYSTEEPFCENDVCSNTSQDSTLDRILAVRTESMIAVPLYFAHECRGVISCVKIANSYRVTANPGGFTMESMREIILASTVLSSLFDYKLLSGVFGWERF
jgi:hypothetical protein